MTHESAVPAPELPALSLAPNEIVPLLIGSTVGEIERELMLQTLARCNGNRTRAARVLGVSVRTLRNKIRQYSAEGSTCPCTATSARDSRRKVRHRRPDVGCKLAASAGY